MRPLSMALTKGRLEKSTVALFEAAGFDCTPLHKKGRKLILPLKEADLDIVLVKAPDVITYIEHGVCDIGIVGKDTIMESGHSFYEMLDLRFGNCRFALAGIRDTDFFSGYNVKRIATKYPNVAKQYFAAKGMDVEIIKIEGSVELAPLMGLADGIVDIVETGLTLRENNLEIIEEIAPISARLIVNVASMKLHKERIEALISKLEAAGKTLVAVK